MMISLFTLITRHCRISSDDCNATHVSVSRMTIKFTSGDCCTFWIVQRIPVQLVWFRVKFGLMIFGLVWSFSSNYYIYKNILLFYIEKVERKVLNMGLTK